MARRYDLQSHRNHQGHETDQQGKTTKVIEITIQAIKQGNNVGDCHMYVHVCSTILSLQTNI